MESRTSLLLNRLKNICNMFYFVLLLIVGGSCSDLQLPPKDSEMAVLLQEFTFLNQQLHEEVLVLREEALNMRKEALSLREEVLNLRKETLDCRLREKLNDMIQPQHGQPLVNTSEANEAVAELVSEVKSLMHLIAGGLERQRVTYSEILPQISSKLDTLGKVVGVVRSEVRLISQHKLTWQNATLGQYQSDFIVDGVYTLSREYNGNNPIQHIGTNRRNNVLMVDLGGIFRIHTVKLWNRLDCCQSYNIGVVVYADEVVIGSINQQKNLFNFPVRGNIFARKVLLKTTRDDYMNFIQIQVFGSGPFTEDEI